MMMKIINNHADRRSQNRKRRPQKTH